MRFALGLWIAVSGLLHAAGLNFPETSKTVHAPSDAKTVSVDFNFSNDADKPVTIARYDAACSCVSVQISGGKMTYAPGESGVVRANFDMGNFSGEVDKSIILWMEGDAAEKPSLQLKVHVQIPVVVGIEPKTLKWDIGGEAKSQTFQIRMNDAKPVKVLGVTTSNENFQYELKTIEEGKAYEIKVTPQSTEAASLAIFRITTDCEIERHRLVQAFASIRKPLPNGTQSKP